MSAPVGSLASEAALLLDAIVGRLEALRPAGDQVPDGDPTAGQEAGVDTQPTPEAVGICPHCGHDPAATEICTACPLCRLLAVLRGERPETTTRLIEGALTVVQALRALLPEPAAAPAAGEPARQPQAVTEPQVAGGIERIVVR